MSGIMGIMITSGHVRWATYETGLNILMNIYPIMVQRYNRIRLYRAINNMEQRDAQKSSSPT